MDALRIKSESGERDEVPTYPVPIARDNLVCAICDAKCTEGSWVIISHPKRKGVIVLSCRGCAPKGVALLSRLL